ncbi:hypothetical protein [Chitinophaga silvisoli]|uniref:Lipoprotein n=1 Tax=Chitinophaga silvisoli TaxID=2291814 RepID=A0A3E1NYQ0_9BACT|nr:hypothetical protein [Chitinophaga silvisoli]RFM33049.1 hypothetical protein DXN04_21710 [Chitinophaga silvisoli]
MSAKSILIALSLFLLQSCTATKPGIARTGNYETAIKNAVIDFHTTSMATHENTFTISFRELDGDIIGVIIRGTVNKVHIYSDGMKTRIPDKYIEYKGKLFYWFDDNSSDPDIVPKLNEYHLIDSVENISQAKLVHDDGKMAMNYYFCKQNLFYYKKVITNKLLRPAMPRNFSCMGK